MTTYKGIKGLGIQNIPSDAVASQAAGGSWASANALNTGRRAQASAGIQTAGLCIAGVNPSATQDTVEKYDGTSWTEVAEVNTARREGSGAGTNTAALFYGGLGPEGESETWNDSAWTATPSLNTAGQGLIILLAGAKNSSVL